MKFNRLLIGCLFTAVSIFLLTSCQQGLTSLDVVYAFQDAGLEANNARPMTADDYGGAPMLGKGSRFFIPSICPECGGRIVVIGTEEEAKQLEAYYVMSEEDGTMRFSWTFRNGNIVLHLNGEELEEDFVKRYEEVLMKLDPEG